MQMKHKTKLSKLSLLLQSQNYVLHQKSITAARFITIALICFTSYLKAQSQKSISESASFGNWGVETQFISTNVLAGNDFYLYVNEGWLKSRSIPAGASGLSNYSEAKGKINERIASIIHEGTLANNTSNSLKQIGALYSGYLNTDKIDKLGLKPIQQDLKQILTLNSYEEVAKWMANPKSFSIISIHTSPDINDRSRFLVTLNESGIGLPSPDYYNKPDGGFTACRKAYIEYIVKTFKLVGISNPDKRANDILEIETKLAAVQWTSAQMRDTKINSTLMSPSKLNNYAPGFPWKVFLACRQVENVEEVILQADSAIKAKAELFANTSIEVWHSYLAFHWIVNHSALLPLDFRQN